MNERPLISIIMPVYNTAMYVDQAIQSIIHQEYADVELILINDGSTDQSLSILEKWSSCDNRVKLFSQENQGLSAARNRGLSLANGQYIYFMDSDDLLRADALSMCLDYCEKKDLDFVYFDASVFADNSDSSILKDFNYSRQKMPAYTVFSGSDALQQQLNTDDFFSSACMYLIRKDILDRNGFGFEPGIVHEDELFTVLLYLAAARVAYIPEQFFQRRVRPDSIMTSRLKLFNITCYFTVARRLREYGRKYSDSRQIIELYLHRMLDAVVWKAHVLSTADRWKVFLLVLTHWRRYVSFKTIGVLLFKKGFLHG
ncbi:MULTISPECIES: glycosyltransferase [Sphingobacterium]|uniref:glycosyltransferase n=1 Tax=Sphingobacterium TaxID=28453 RepID=UPI00257E19E4|nr:MULTISPECIES: glycosyltransferase [Sphingobacterium]